MHNKIEMYNIFDSLVEQYKVKVKFKDIGLKYNLLIAFDFLIYVFEEMYKNGDVTNSIKGLNELICGFGNYTKYNNHISKIRHLCKSFSNSDFFYSFISRYRKIDKHIRMFNIDENFSVERNRAYSYTDLAEKVFNNILNSSLAFEDNKKEFFQFNETFTTKGYFINNNQKEEIEFKFIEGNKLKQFVPVDKKKKLFITKEDLTATAELMDSMNSKGYYKERVEKIKFYNYIRKTNRYINEDNIEISGVKNIVGMVGAGKSTLMKVISKICSDKENHKIALVVNNIQEVDSFINELNKYNIKAISLTSYNRRKEHYNKVIKDNISVLEQLHEVAKREHLNNLCLLNVEKKDVHTEINIGEEPCFNIGYNIKEFILRDEIKVTTDKKTICPYIKKCHKFNQYEQLEEASVFVCTPQNLIHSKIPPYIYDRDISVLEFVYGFCDVVIVDEADEVQNTLDNNFAPLGNILEGNNYGWLNTIAANIVGTYVSDSFANLWQKKVLNAIEYVRKINFLIDDKSIQKWLSNFVDSNYLAYSFIKNYKSTINKKMENLLLNDSNENLVVLEEFQKLFFDNKDKFDKTLKTYGLDNESYTVIKKLMVIVLLKCFSNDLKFIMENFEVCSSHFNIKNNNMDISFNKRFAAILPDFPAGNLFKFKITRRESNNWMFLSILNTQKVGRHLLYKMPELFKYSHGVDGPSLVLLSGTSFAGESPVFNINKLPDTIIEGSRSEIEAINKSKALFIPVKDEKGNSYSISGLQGEKRLQAISLVLNGLIEEERYSTFRGKSIIKGQLEVLEKEFEDRNRILLVTGSYSEASFSADFLRKHAKKIGLKDNEIINIVRDGEVTDEYCVNRGNISELGTTNVKMIVAPMTAVGRAHNILNKNNVAAIGTVIFLLRNMINPSDEGYYISYINDDWMKNCSKVKYKKLYTLTKVKYKYRGKLNSLISNSIHLPGYSALLKEDKDRICWTLLAMLVQTIGRSVRGGEKTYCFFVDGKYAPNAAKGDVENDKESVLVNIVNLLKPYFENNDTPEAQAVQKLYEPFYNMLSNINGIEF